MQWRRESKEAFVQALNTEFLTTAGAYTNFKFRGARNCRSGQIYMLFPSDEQEECQKYLEQVTAKYKGAITSIESTIICADNFPFCVSPGRFSYDKSKKAIKFKVSLNKKVMDNLYHIFINQFLSFELDVTNMPSDLTLDENDKRQGYIAGWVFLENDHSSFEKKEIVNGLLRKYGFQIMEKSVTDPDVGLCHCIYIRQNGVEQAIQRAIEDFPAKLLKQYPRSLFTLFNIFYRHLVNFKNSQKEEISLGCTQFVEMLDQCKNTAKTNGNTVYFYYRGDYAGAIRGQEAIYEICKCKDGERTFRDFIKIVKENQNNIKVSFKFDLHNIDVIMNKVPCNIDYVEEARELTIKQLSGTARPICAKSSNKTSKTSNSEGNGVSSEISVDKAASSSVCQIL